MSEQICKHGKHVENPCVECDEEKAERQSELSATAGYAVGGDFYNGIEWLACWLLDHAEGEIITEEKLRPWAAKAWAEHIKRHNAALCRPGVGAGEAHNEL